MQENVIEINSLKTFFYLEEGVFPAIDDITFNIKKNKTLGVVGESGCGKSVTALSIMRLIENPGKIVSGEIMFKKKNNKDIDLLKINPMSKTMRSIRGNDISMIFQEPMTSMNPVFTIGDQIVEVIRLHKQYTYDEAKQTAIKILKDVGIPSPEIKMNEYPHQQSGGIRQRAMIAMALSCNPLLLIADEPTTALDVTIQAQVLELMKTLQNNYNTSILFITHDLGVISEMCDDVIVMYMGKIVEQASVNDLFNNPKHPYTIGLMNSIPSIDSNNEKPLITIKGNVPNPFEITKGCKFQSRCPNVMEICKNEEPKLTNVSNNHNTSCFLYN
mgnify:CR=1 FL=1